jgi:hypothetical protein
MRRPKLLITLILGFTLVTQEHASANLQDVLASFNEHSVDDLVSRMCRCGGSAPSTS